MFAVDWDRYDEGPRGWFPHTAGVLMDFIMFAEHDKYRSRFDQVIAGVIAGKPGPQLFAEIFPEIPGDGWDVRISAHDRDLQYLAAGPLRGLCPMGFEIPRDKMADPDQRETTPVPPAQISVLLDALKRLPRRDDGYPAWYPPEVIARVLAPDAKTPGR
jgi:hypothetical protein